MKNNRAFTLVELLATITILGIIMMVAVPNVVGIVKRNKDKTYIEDAKKLVTLAEYKFRTTNDLTVSGNSCIVMTMSYLGNEEFENAPNGGMYDDNRSFVAIVFSNNTYNYYVTLVEKINSSYRGIDGLLSTDLYKDEAINSIKSKKIDEFLNPGSAGTQILLNGSTYLISMNFNYS